MTWAPTRAGKQRCPECSDQRRNKRDPCLSVTVETAGVVWFWFIDVFAVACVIFAVTGLALLWLHARGRPSTWPIVGLGLLIPVVIALLFIH